MCYNAVIMKLKRHNTHLAQQQVQKLKVLSNQTGLSVAELIRRAVDQYLEEKLMSNEGGQDVRESFRDGISEK